MDGVAAEAHLGRELRDTVPPAMADVLEPLFRGVLETGEPFFDREFTGPVPQAPEHEGCWLVGCSPIDAKDGTRLGIQVIVQDITTRKQAEGIVADGQHYRILRGRGDQQEPGWRDQ
jgi:PAS domain S-box-containing protein